MKRSSIAYILAGLFYVGCSMNHQSYEQHRTVQGEIALHAFWQDVGRLPLNEEGFQVLLEPPEDEGLAKRWRGPYLETFPHDPHGNPLQYSRGEGPGTYKIYSWDGRFSHQGSVEAQIDKLKE